MPAFFFSVLEGRTRTELIGSGRWFVNFIAYLLTFDIQLQYPFLSKLQYIVSEDVLIAQLLTRSQETLKNILFDSPILSRLLRNSSKYFPAIPRDISAVVHLALWGIQ